MTMSVAVQSASETAPRSPQAQLASSSFVGAAFLLVCLQLIFGALPTLWNSLFRQVVSDTGKVIVEPVLFVIEPFLSGALLLLVTIAALAIFVTAAYRLDKQVAIKGHRAGIAVASLFLFVIVWLTLLIGNRLVVQQLDETVGVVISLAAFGAMLFGVFWLFRMPGFYAALVALDEQGWFYAIPFKPNQGFKVRRGTVIGLLALGLCGIITFVTHGAFGSGARGDNDWYWEIPFTKTAGQDASGVSTDLERHLPLLSKIHVTVPLIMGVLMLWFSWRVVNWPVFADFLIATEAEINKVSWTTRKRLVQDTIVVLVTVFLLTTYLFVIDIVWIKVLSLPFIDVLKVDVRSEQAKQQEKSQW
jgi:preprotein translocase SecE subunit